VYLYYLRQEVLKTASRPYSEGTEVFYSPAYCGGFQGSAQPPEASDWFFCVVHFSSWQREVVKTWQ
jgi:hypothetical protein